MSRLRVHWSGPFYTNSSIATVNRRLVGALIARNNIDVTIGSDPLPPQNLPPEFRVFAERRAQAEDPDVAIVHEFPPRFAAPRGARYVHVQPWEFGSMPRDWFDALHGDCDDIWVHSNFNRNVYVADGIDPNRVAVIPHGVDRGVFSPDGPKMQISAAGFRFLFIGGTIKRKGIDLLLQAYSRAFRRTDDVVLTIKDAHTETLYRGQTLREDILALSARTDIPRIEYTDAIFPDAAMAQLLRAADCLVLPYRGEGFALPVLEAMACAKPVIVTAGGATDDFVDDAAGWRISSMRTALPAGTPVPTVREQWVLEPDVDALAAAMRDAFEHRDVLRTRGAAAAARAAGWTWNRAAEIAEQRLLHVSEREPVTPKRRAERYEDPATYEERIFGTGKLDGVLLETFRRIGVASGTFVEIADNSFTIGPTLERGMAWRSLSLDEAGADLDMLSVARVDDRLAPAVAAHRPRVLALCDDSRAVDGYTVIARDREGSAMLLVRGDLAERAGFPALSSSPA